MNSENEIRLRRYKANLRNSGGGYILFAFWGLMKFLMTVTMRKDYFWDLIALDPDDFINEADRILVYTLSATLVLAVMLFVLLIHLFIGMGAIRYGRDKSRKRTFYYCAVIMFVISALSCTSYIPILGNHPQYNDTTLAAMLVDLGT